MRFDLEIPTTNNMKLTFIREGDSIPSVAVPLIYHRESSLQLFPKDFISAESGYSPKEFISGGYEKIQGPEIHNPKSDTFIITDVVKYSNIDGSITPLFYKHTIGEAVEADAIKIIDFFGAVVSKDLYTVNIKTNTTDVYINKQDKILFIEYITEMNSVKRVLLNLIPVYEEASWVNILNKNIDDKKYIYFNNIISTSYDKDLYIAYLSDTKLFRPPLGNLEDPWYVGILNTSFKISGRKYWVPEFYLQDLDTDYRYKKVINKKCEKLLNNYIKTQYPIARHATDSLFVYVYDYYTNIIKYAFSSDESLDGLEYKDGVMYTKLGNFNIDGVVEIPINLLETDVVYATHYTDEYYYEYKGLDIKNIFNNNIDYVGIFIKPNIEDTERSVSHALIGYNSNASNVMKTIEEYNTYISTNNYFNVAIIAIVNPTNESKDDEYIELSSLGNIIIDKNSACKIDVDVMLNDIKNQDVILPTNDTLVAHINISDLVSNGIIKYTYTDGSYVFDDYSKGFFKKINDTLNESLDVSTSSILEFNFNKEIQ